MGSLLYGLHKMRKELYIHNDIIMHNILIDHNYVMNYIDFGLSKDLRWRNNTKF